MEILKPYRIVKYEYHGYKGIVFIGKSITNERDIKEICTLDFLESHIKDKKAKVIEDEINILSIERK